MHLPSDRQQPQSQQSPLLQQQVQQHEQQQRKQEHQQEHQQEQNNSENLVPIRDSIALNDIESFEVRQATSVPIPLSANMPRSPLLISTAKFSPVPSDPQPTSDVKPISEVETFLELPSQTRKFNSSSVSGQDTIPSSKSSIVSSLDPGVALTTASESNQKLQKVAETNLNVEKYPVTNSITSNETSNEPKTISSVTTVNEPEFNEYMENITKRAQKLNEEISKPSAPSSGEKSIPDSAHAPLSPNLRDKQDPALSSLEISENSIKVPLSQSIDDPIPNIIQSEPVNSKINEHNSAHSGNHHHRHTSHNVEGSYYDNDSFDEDIYGYYADSDDNDNQEKEDLFKSSLDHDPNTSDKPIASIKEPVSPVAGQAEQTKPGFASTVSNSNTNEPVQPSVSSIDSKDNSRTINESNDASGESSFKSSKIASPLMQQLKSTIDSIATSPEPSPLPAEPALATHTFVKPPIPTSSYADSDNESINKVDESSYGKWKSIEPIKSRDFKLDENEFIETKSVKIPEPTNSQPNQFNHTTDKQLNETTLSRPPIPTSSNASDSDTDLSKIASSKYEMTQPGFKVSDNHSTGVSSPKITYSQQEKNIVSPIDVQFGSHSSEDDKSSSTPTAQSALEKDIMKSFENSGYKTNAPIPIIATSHNEPVITSSEYSLPNSPAVPDPEIAALYRDNSHFLTRPLSQLIDDFPATQPLSPQRSRELPPIRSLDEVLEGNDEDEEEMFEDNQLKRTDSSSSWETQLNASTNSRNIEPEESSDIILNPKNPSRGPVLEQASSTNSLSNLSPVSSRAESTNTEKSPKYMSMILNDKDVESAPSHESVMKNRDSGNYDYLNRHGTLATTIINPMANETTSTIVPDHPVHDKLISPPEFDFSAILTKPRSEDRKKAFDEARHKQAEYKSGLETWLEQVSAQMEPNTLRSLGVVTMPTPASHAKPAAPIQKSSTIFSASSLKPKGSLKPSVLKQGIAGKLSISKVGEKSSGAASRLFAKGRKLMKSDK